MMKNAMMKMKMKTIKKKLYDLLDIIGRMLSNPNIEVYVQNCDCMGHSKNSNGGLRRG